MRSIIYIKSLLFIVAIFLVACNGYYAPQPLRILGSQKEFQHFHATSDSNYFFLTSEKKINVLTFTKQSVDLTGTVPIPQDFERIKGKKDTIYVQTATSIKLFKNGLNAWEEIASIDGVKACDDFVVLGKILLVAKGNGLCRGSSETRSVLVYDLSNPKLPLLKNTYGLSGTGIASTLQLATYQNNILLLSKEEGLMVFELSGDKLIKISSNEALKGEKLTVFESKKIAFLATVNGIQQLTLKNLKNIQVLSTFQ